MSNPWIGTIAIERVYHNVRNPLVDICLNGVVGVQEGPRSKGGHARVKMVDADRYIAKGHAALSLLQAQKPPRLAEAKRILAKYRDELARFQADAEAVRFGHKTPRMDLPL